MQRTTTGSRPHSAIHRVDKMETQAWLFVATAGHAEVQEGNRVDEVQEKESSR
jgi:hypothetical protein